VTINKVALMAARLPPANDGVGDHADRLAGALSARGQEVVVIAAGEAAPSANYALELAGADWGIASTLRAIAQLAAHRPDALVVEYTPFLYGARSPAPMLLLLAARALGVRSAIVVHEAFYARTHDGVGGSALKAKLLAVRDGATLRSADEIIVPSVARAEATARALPSMRDRLHVVPIGANIEPPASYCRAPASPPNVVAFGVVSRRRRLERAIDAVANLAAAGSDIRLTIAGRIFDRAYAAELSARAEHAGIDERVVFCDELSPAALSALLGGAAVAIHAAREGAVASSGSMLALLAHGVPTVAVRTPDDDAVYASALQMTDDNTDAIAAALSALIGDPVAAAAQSARARDLYCAQFAWDSIAGSLLAVLMKERTNARLVTA
jgi:glycosyltransferase involved in cell wall biosynthesis